MKKQFLMTMMVIVFTNAALGVPVFWQNVGQWTERKKEKIKKLWFCAAAPEQHNCSPSRAVRARAWLARQKVSASSIARALLILGIIVTSGMVLYHKSRAKAQMAQKEAEEFESAPQEEMSVVPEWHKGIIRKTRRELLLGQPQTSKELLLGKPRAEYQVIKELEEFESDPSQQEKKEKIRLQQQIEKEMRALEQVQQKLQKAKKEVG